MLLTSHGIPCSLFSMRANSSLHNEEGSTFVCSKTVRVIPDSLSCKSSNSILQALLLLTLLLLPNSPAAAGSLVYSSPVRSLKAQVVVAALRGNCLSVQCLRSLPMIQPELSARSQSEALLHPLKINRCISSCRWSPSRLGKRCTCIALETPISLPRRLQSRSWSRKKKRKGRSAAELRALRKKHHLGEFSPAATSSRKRKKNSPAARKASRKATPRRFIPYTSIGAPQLATQSSGGGHGGGGFEPSGGEGSGSS